MSDGSTILIQARRWRGESLVRTEETKRVLHRVGSFAVHSGDRADHHDFYVSHQNGLRVPQSGHDSLEAAKRFADACAVVLAGLVLPVSADEGARLMREIRAVAARDGRADCQAAQ